MAEGESNLKLVLTPVLKLFIGVVVLLIIGTIINALPMVRDIPTAGFPVSIPEIVRALVATLVLVLLINFAFEFGDNLEAVIPAFPEAGTISRWVVFLIAVIVAFVAYDAIARAFLGEQKWIYSLFFVVIALVPIVSLLVLFYRHMGQIADLIVSGTVSMGQSRRGARAIATSAASVLCPSCRSPVSKGAKFCRSCGEKIVAPSEPSEAQGSVTSSCPGCGAALSPNARFCTACGTMVTGES